MKKILTKLIVVGAMFYGIWWFLGHDLDTYDGCTRALYSQFTGISDKTERMNMAKFRCDELVIKGKVNPPAQE